MTRSRSLRPRVINVTRLFAFYLVLVVALVCFNGNNNNNGVWCLEEESGGVVGDPEVEAGAKVKVEHQEEDEREYGAKTTEEEENIYSTPPPPRPRQQQKQRQQRQYKQRKQPSKLEQLWKEWKPRFIATIAVLFFIEFIVKRPAVNPPRQQRRPQQQRSMFGSNEKPTVNDTTATTTTTTTNMARDSSPSGEVEEQQQREEVENEYGDDDGDDNDEAEMEEMTKTDDDNDEGSKKQEKKSTTTKTKAKKKVSSSSTSNRRTSTPRQPSAPTPPPPMKATNNAHPGMDGFGYWYEIETSLYRIYTLGRDDDVQVVPPYVPHSHRGNVSVFLHVTNSTTTTLNVFWVDYKGKHVLKGKIKPNHVWTQSTWIDHPWVFESAETEIPYLYYVPYRVIPTTPEVPTMTDDDDTGRHQFVIGPPTSTSEPYLCSVQDKVMPFPSRVHFHTPLLGITWTLQHMTRLRLSGSPILHDGVIDTMQKYLTNIINHPDTIKYRQLRISGKKFSSIWLSPLRGLLLSVGFVEVGAYAELGCSSHPLSRQRIQDIALLSYMIAEWKKKQDTYDNNINNTNVQPDGADGFGRAGYGRAGNMNF